MLVKLLDRRFSSVVLVVSVVEYRAFIDEFLVRHRISAGVGDALDIDDDGSMHARMLSPGMRCQARQFDVV